MNERWNNLVIALMAIPVYVIMIKHSMFSLSVDWAGVYLIFVISLVLYIHIRHNVIKVKSKE